MNEREWAAFILGGISFWIIIALGRALIHSVIKYVIYTRPLDNIEQEWGIRIPRQ